MDIKTLNKLIPSTLKTAMANHEHHKIFMSTTGMSEVTLAKIAEYVGAKVVARQAKWRPVFDGIKALENLRRS